MRNANKSPKMPYSAMVRKVIWNPYLETDHQQKLIDL